MNKRGLFSMASGSRSSRIDSFIISFTNLLISVILLIDETSNVTCVDNPIKDVKKCCSFDTVLTLSGENYSCEYPSQDTDSEFIERKSGSRGFPVCQNAGNLTAIPLADIDADDFPYDYCVDNFLYEKEKNYEEDEEEQEISYQTLPTVLFCSNSNQTLKQTDIPTLLKVRRCCPMGEIFKMTNRACLLPKNTDQNISTSYLVRNIGTSDFIHVLRGPPKCQHAIVDFEVNVTDVSIVADRLQVTASNSYDVVDLLATEESACLDAGSSDGLLVVRACRGVEYCRKNTCLRKCCMEDEALVTSSCQKLPSHLTLAKWHSEVWDIPETMANDTTLNIMNTSDYGLLVGKPCRYGMYPVLKHEGWIIEPQGMIHVPAYKTYQHHEYCTDMFYNTSLTTDGFYPFICFEDPPAEEKIIPIRLTVNASLLLISCVFLLITLLVYICIPTLQNLHGKTLMCHVGSLLVSFVCLVMVAIATPDEESLESEAEAKKKIINSVNLCRFLGYFMLFSFLSAFFWLNVMCFDIWWKFGSLRNSGRTNTKRRGDFKRFSIYCLYAWGLAFCFAVVALVFDSLKYLPRGIQPGMGFDKCWFTTGRMFYGEIIFFIGPVSVQLLVNLVFYILTARKCSMVKAEIQKRAMANRPDPRSRRFEADKTKLILNVKLFVVMGVSWVLEIISYFINNYATNLEWKYEFFYVADVLNCLQGLMIFVLFVLKKKVFQALARKFGKGRNRRASTGGIHDPYRVRKSPSSSTILSTFAVSSSP